MEQPPKILLASWPQSGARFLRHVIEALYGIPTYAAYRESPGAAGLFGGNRSWPADAAPGLPAFFVQTHAVEAATTPDAAIHLIRDGRDAIDRYARQMCESPLRIISGVGTTDDSGSWGLHTLAWLSRPAVRVFYENLIAEPVETVRKAIRCLALAIPETKYTSMQTPAAVLAHYGEAGAWRHWPAFLHDVFAYYHGWAHKAVEELRNNGRCPH